MKSITFTLEDKVAEWLRLEAARCNTSVSRLVGELLTEKMQRTVRCERAMQEALKFQSIPFEGPYLKRDEIYAERLDRFR